MAHLSKPRVVKRFLVLGHNLDHMLVGGGPVASRRCSLSSFIASRSSASKGASSCRSLPPASEISPGFLSNNPLNCWRARLWISWTTEWHTLVHKQMEQLIWNSVQHDYKCYKTEPRYVFDTNLLLLFQFEKSCIGGYFWWFVNAHHLKPRRGIQMGDK